MEKDIKNPDNSFVYSTNIHNEERVPFKMDDPISVKLNSDLQTKIN
jgi:hypothetical protein